MVQDYLHQQYGVLRNTSRPPRMGQPPDTHVTDTHWNDTACMLTLTQTQEFMISSHHARFCGPERLRLAPARRRRPGPIPWQTSLGNP